MAAGSIIIDILAKTSSFVTDTGRAEKSLKKFQKQAEETGKVIGVAIAGGITIAAVAFDQLLKSAAQFKDFEETVGASAEDIASLAIAAATAGVSMEAVTGATIKLTKGLTGVDDESKAVGAALTALGINIEDFKRLDPVGQYEAVGKALAGFADGAQKTAVAVALFGKAGAEQLKVFKALEEQGGRQVILTQAQIELADKYADAQAKQIATFKLYAQAAATDVLPALNDLAEAALEVFRAFSGIDAAGKKLAGESQVKAFAEGAVNALAFVIDSGQGVIRIFDAVGKFIAGTAAAAVAAAKLDFAALKVIQEAAREDIEKTLSADLFSQRLARIQAAAKRVSESGQNDPRELARRGRGPATLPQLGFDGPEKPVKAKKDQKDKTTEADKYIESLNKQIQKTQELTEVEKVLDDIVNGRFEGAKAGQANQALALADQLDKAKQLEAANKLVTDQLKQQAQESERLRDAGARVFEDTRTPAEQYAIQLERINTLLNAGVISTDTYQRAVVQLQDQFDENAARTKDIARDVNSSLEGGFANAFAGFVDGSMSAKDAFKSFANSVISDLIRIASQEAARALFKSGSDGSGGLGGLLSGLFKNNGGGTASQTDLNQGIGYYGMSTGTNSVPYDGFKATLHKGEAVVPAKYNPAQGARSDSIQVINPPGVQLTAKATQQQGPDGRAMKRIVLSVIADDFKAGGQVSKAFESSYGGKRQTPRRG